MTSVFLGTSMYPAVPTPRRLGRGDRLKIKGLAWFHWFLEMELCPCRIGLSRLCGAIWTWLNDIDWDAAP